MRSVRISSTISRNQLAKPYQTKAYQPDWRADATTLLGSVCINVQIHPGLLSTGKNKISEWFTATNAATGAVIANLAPSEYKSSATMKYLQQLCADILLCSEVILELPEALLALSPAFARN